jgi:tetratricopeptide (TPR) repeat protein
VRALLRSLLVACALAVVPVVARADTPPGSWDVARDPSAADRWALHVRVVHIERQIARIRRGPTFDDPSAGAGGPGDAENLAVTALAMLESADSDAHPDTRLRFDLGIVRCLLGDLTGRIDYYDKGARTLADALARAPDGEGSTEALATLAQAYAHLAKPHEELETWHRYLPRIENPAVAIVDGMNMGEAQMRVGRVDDALVTFRDLVRQCGDAPVGADTYTLILWDLAIAQDRTGDARGAMETAARATGQTIFGVKIIPIDGLQLLTEDENVFFVPEWERDWYLALGNEVKGRAQTKPELAVRYLQRAESEWDEYVTKETEELGGPVASRAVKAGDDPGKIAAAGWLRIAHLRRDRVHAALTAAAKKLPKHFRMAPPEIQ